MFLFVHITTGACTYIRTCITAKQQSIFLEQFAPWKCTDVSLVHCEHVVTVVLWCVCAYSSHCNRDSHYCMSFWGGQNVAFYSLKTKLCIEILVFCRPCAEI